MQKQRVKVLSTLAFVAVIAVAVAAYANHSWGGYHWARTANPFTIKLGNNLSSGWQTYLSKASSDWSKSTVLDTSIVAGQSGSRKCRATLGRVEVCNNTYGNNGWLGIASISLQSGTLHITQGTVRLNDTYFNQAQYNTAAWRQMVACQEIGHTFGLDHQDTNFTNTNLGTCMDYTNNPTGGGTNGSLSNTSPNQHDYDELVTIYSHLDSSTTIGAAPVVVAARAEEDDELPAEVVAHRYKSFLEDRGNGEERVTFVFWAPR